MVTGVWVVCDRSITSGVVSRIEVTSYSHGATELLGVQIDAAINRYATCVNH